MRQLLRRCWYLLRQRRFEQDLREELEFHRDEKQRELQDARADAHQARFAAQKALGSIALAHDQVRDVWIPRWLQGIGQDLRVAVRTLRATPVITAVAILSLALGIGANTAIFSIVNSLVLRTLPVREPAQLVLVTDPDATRAAPWSYAIWQHIRDRADLFGERAAWSFARFNAGSASEPQLINGLWVSGSFFSTLGVETVLGRPLAEADDQVGGGADGPVTVISFAFWQTRFAGAADVIGQHIVLSGVPFTIVGVAPSDFLGPEVGRSFAVAVPLGDEPLFHQHDSFLADAGTRFLTIVGRLRDDQSLTSASTALLAAQPDIRDATRPRTGNVSPQTAAAYLRAPFVLRPAATGTSGLRSSYQKPLAIVQYIVSVILLIACLNITNLLLARASVRRHELSVRVALGGSAWRIARQLLVESSLLSFVGAALGMGVAKWMDQLLVTQFSFTGNTVVLDVRPDVRVWTFTAIITVVTTMLFGTVPALRASRVAPIDAMKMRGGTHADRRGRQWMSWLLIVQVALSLVLSAAAALFVRSFATLSGQSLGFEPGGVMVVTVDTTLAVGAERIGLYERALDITRGLPSVADAGASYLPPIGYGAYTPPILVDGRDEPAESLSANIITPAWLATLKAHIVAGRDFTDRDAPGAPRVAIVNQAFARRMFGREVPLGRTFTAYPHTAIALGPLTIVGVVEDMAYQSVRQAAPPTWFVPLAQFDVPQFPLYSVALMVRARNERQNTFADVARAIVSTSPQLTVTLRPLPDYIRATLTRDRVMALLGGFFGALALLLSSLGLYGVTAYTVSCQRADIGIRLALGATPRRVFRGVASHTMWRVMCGIVLGLGLSAYAWRFVASLLFGLAPRDPFTFAMSASAFICIAALAASVPAWRASRIDPAAVLRSE